jgi:plastocyanin
MKLVYLSLIFTALVGCSRSDNNNNPPGNSGTSNGTVEIIISEGATGKGPAAYGANPLHVPVGSKVVWRNDDDESHSATSNTGVWNTGTLKQGQSSTAVTFDRPGTFPYFCTLHGRASMSGTIVVP